MSQLLGVGAALIGGGAVYLFIIRPIWAHVINNLFQAFGGL